MMNSSYGMIGLGKMGALAVENVLSKGIKVAVYDLFQEQVNELSKLGAKGCRTLKELVDHLVTPRVIWLMVPAGDPIEEVLFGENGLSQFPVSYTHLRAHETRHDLVCRLLLEKKKNNKNINTLITR